MSNVFDIQLTKFHEKSHCLSMVRLFSNHVCLFSPSKKQQQNSRQLLDVQSSLFSTSSVGKKVA